MRKTFTLVKQKLCGITHLLPASLPMTNYELSLAYIITKCTKLHQPLWVAMVTDANQTCSQVRVPHPKKTSSRISALLSQSVTTNPFFFFNFPFTTCPFLPFTHGSHVEMVVIVLLSTCTQIDRSPAFSLFSPQNPNLSSNMSLLY